MKIIIAPQSFKGSLTAKEATNIILDSAKSVFPNAELIGLPIADGGDGTLETIIDATNGELINSNVKGPDNRIVEASWGLFNSEKNEKTAIIEMARASGLAMLDPNNLDPFNSTTFGTGELIINAVKNGAKKIILGIGGSATNDCGIGVAKAVGIKFLDSKKNEIDNNVANFSKIREINLNNFNPELKNIKFEVACDVTNTLCGIEGASYIYGPQKGASIDDIKILDKNLLHIGNLIEKELNLNVLNLKGGGAAGGLGAGMVAFFGATLRPGVDIIFDTLNVEEKIKDADLIITGEGQFDISSTYNKAPTAIAKLGKKYNIPAIGISGSFGEGFDKLDEFGILSKSTLINKISTLDDNIKDADNLLRIASVEQLKAIKIGMNL
ncbi:MAG: glycerate kinase [Chloroflexota bacterium]|nr:glycerate kinase [Chloroflexota bacterium]